MGTFIEEKFSSSAVVKGITAFAEKENACIHDTGIYLPPGHSFSSSTVNIVVWFHGFYVQNARDLMHPDDAGMDMHLRQSVLKSQKDAILVAPWQGLKSGSSSGKLSLDALGQGNGLQTFLDQVLDGIARFQKTLSSAAASSLTLGNLILAGHSAGGAQMREASKHLGAYQDNLRECWGFDCFYDDLYPGWIKAGGNTRKYLYFAHGSGGAGLYAFNLMKMVYGTPKNPIRDNQRIPNMYLAPAVDRFFTSRDDVAFQSIEEILDWGPAGPNLYNDIRKATDPFLDDGNQSRYWNKILPKLTGHFQMVRDLFGPRISQSQWL
jgi:hypothetical protein